MKIKVCGITRLDQMQQLQDMGIDYAGMIFYEGSKRFFGERSKDEKGRFKNTSINKIGVFVNADFETILKAIKHYDLYAVQLHGDETDEFCLELMDKAKVIKVFRISDNKEIDELTKPFQNVCHYFLFDTETTSYGGSGKTFDWSYLEKAKIDKPFFLSGGIGLDDVEKIQAFQHPCLFAVDVNSRFETEPGIKNIEQVAQFAAEIKQ